MSENDTEDTFVCSSCGKEYKNVALHWTTGSCGYPGLSEMQKETSVGLLMGDGTLSNRSGENPRLVVRMTTPKYLKYIDSLFGNFGKGVSLRTTAKEKARMNAKSGFSKGAKEENYSDMYGWRSMTHPHFKKYESWYVSGEKVWPEDIILSPTVLKHWYSGDGTWANTQTANAIKISAANELGNQKKIDNIFSNSNLPEPNSYVITEREVGTKRMSINFTTKDSKLLWEHMGSPPPGFEYKWPQEYQQ